MTCEDPTSWRMSWGFSTTYAGGVPVSGDVDSFVARLDPGGGALLYSTFWLAAGLTAPTVGGTGEAKEILSFLAIPGAGLCLPLGRALAR